MITLTAAKISAVSDKTSLIRYQVNFQANPRLHVWQGAQTKNLFDVGLEHA
jgi:hypothetical protein